MASGLRSTKCLPSKQTRGLDAGECREAVGACLLKHISCACSWRSHPARCPSAGDSVRPALAEHIGSDFSAARGSFSTKIQNDTARDQGSMAMAVSASDASMGKSDAILEKPPRLLDATPCRKEHHQRPVLTNYALR